MDLEFNKIMLLFSGKQKVDQILNGDYKIGKDFEIKLDKV